MENPSGNVCSLADYQFKSLAVLDLETCTLPEYNFNKCAITELSIYGFSIKELEKEANDEDDVQQVGLEAKVPTVPRILHKLNLLFNPLMMVHPTAESITGLNNYMLELESPFNKNACTVVINFLQHLQQPVCLVAHNGLQFDFPIIKRAISKYNMELPQQTVCVDSLLAFPEIDEKRESCAVELALSLIVPPSNSNDNSYDNISDLSESTDLKLCSLEIDAKNAQIINETTPKRPTLSTESRALKRKTVSEDDSSSPSQRATTSNASNSKSRRALFQDSVRDKGNSRKRKYLTPGKYKLSNLFERVFGKSMVHAHQAENDVNALMKLILHYGTDFLDYSTENSIPFAEVREISACR